MPPEASSSHPFRGKIRPLEEIAAMCGLSVARVAECIARDLPIPLPRSLQRQPVDLPHAVHQQASRRGGAVTAAKFAAAKSAAAARDPAAAVDRRQLRALEIVIDGRTYRGVAATAKAWGVSASHLKRCLRQYGPQLHSDQLRKKSPGRKKKSSAA